MKQPSSVLSHSVSGPGPPGIVGSDQHVAFVALQRLYSFDLLTAFEATRRSGLGRHRICRSIIVIAIDCFFLVSCGIGGCGRVLAGLGGRDPFGAGA